MSGEYAREHIGVGKVAAAVDTVDTYTHRARPIEAGALAALCRRVETVSTQITLRARHAERFCSSALLAARIDRLAPTRLAFCHERDISHSLAGRNPS